MHLTNNFYNVNNKNYIETDEIFEKNNGTKRTLTSLWKSLEDMNIQKEDIFNKVLEAAQLYLLSCAPFLKAS